VEYLQEARSLWQTSVPLHGQAATVQGELLRAVENLRDEAQRNGNLNWGSGQEAFIAYLRENLIGSALFDQTAAREIEPIWTGWASSNIPRRPRLHMTGSLIA
jgi:hypothetical protein